MTEKNADITPSSKLILRDWIPFNKLRALFTAMKILEWYK